MHKFKYIVLDDEAACINELLFILKKNAPDLELVGQASSFDEAIKLFADQKPDIAFLDIDIKGKNVFDLLPLINWQGVHIVFVTAHEDYILKALRLSAVDYLLKPIQTEELLTALNKIRGAYNTPLASSHISLDTLLHNLNRYNKVKKIGIPHTKGYAFKDLSELIYIQAAGNYSELYFTDGKKYLLAKTLGEYESLLAEFHFIRIHQSYLVNLAFFEYFNSEDLTLTLSSGKTLPVSTRRKTILLEKVKMVI
jgi:two-component system, LytTR family, response regulator